MDDSIFLDTSDNFYSQVSETAAYQYPQYGVHPYGVNQYDVDQYAGNYLATNTSHHTV